MCLFVRRTILLRDSLGDVAKLPLRSPQSNTHTKMTILRGKNRGVKMDLYARLATTTPLPLCKPAGRRTTTRISFTEYI